MEIEFKFQIPADRLAALKADLRSAPTRRTRLRARYFDTADGVLAAHGAVLRLRQEGDRWVQTAKALGDGPLHRLEHNADLGPVQGGEPPQPDVGGGRVTEHGADVAHREHDLRHLPPQLLPGAACGLGEHLNHLQRPLHGLGGEIGRAHV